jgi:membrane protease YdiL (CAAX protease family)
MKTAHSAPELTPRAVIAGALTAGSAHLLIWILLGVSEIPSLQALAGLLAYGGIFALLASRLGAAPATRLGLVRPRALAALAVLLLLPSLILLSEIDNLVRAFLMSDEFRALLEQAAQPGPEVNAVMRAAELILIQVAVFPVTYELLFRGLVQPVLVQRHGALRGVALTAAVEVGSLFLTRLNAYDVPQIFATGLVLGAVRECSGSLFPSLALRALIGAASVGATFHLFGIPGFDDLEAAHTPAAWLIAAGISTGAGFWICARLRGARGASDS